MAKLVYVEKYFESKYASVDIGGLIVVNQAINLDHVESISKDEIVHKVGPQDNIKTVKYPTINFYMKSDRINPLQWIFPLKKEKDRDFIYAQILANNSEDA